MLGNSLRFGEACTVYRQFFRIVPAVIFINVCHVCKPVLGFYDFFFSFEFLPQDFKVFFKVIAQNIQQVCW